MTSFSKGNMSVSGKVVCTVRMAGVRETGRRWTSLVKIS